MELQGSHTAEGLRVAVVVARFNPEITDGLLAGALGALRDAAVADADVTVVRVPGAFELPLAASRLATSGRFDAIVCLGCLIKGDTMHFEYIADAASHGIMEVATRTGLPVAFGLLTTLTDEQAVERSRPGEGNKGREAAQAAIEMATLLERLEDGVQE